VRWRTNPGDLAYPDEFLEHLETRGELLDLDRWVTDRALQATQRFGRPEVSAGAPDWVSVNLSPPSLRDADFCDRLRSNGPDYVQGYFLGRPGKLSGTDGDVQAANDP